MTQEIAEIPIPKVELPVEYGLGWRNNPLNSQAIAVNYAIPFEEFESNSSSISKGSGTNFSQINLKGGKCYKLSCFFRFGEQGTSVRSDLTYRWYSLDKNMFFGSKGGARVATDSYPAGGGTAAIAYVRLEKDTTFEVRVETISADGPNHIDVGTSFDIQHLQNLQI